jgi:capsular exopolysaccharide synthesis family protein
VSPWATAAFLRRWWWLYLMAMLLAGAASYIVSGRIPKTYEASAKLLVTPGGGNGTGTDYNLLLAAQNLTQTYAELAKTNPVLDAARLAAGDPPDAAVPAVDAAPVRDTQLVQITARGKDPDQVAAFANLVSAALIQQVQASQSSRFAASKDGLSKQLEQVSTDLADRTDQLVALRAQAPSLDRDGELAGIEFQIAQLQQTYATAARSYEDVRLAEARGTDILTPAEPARPSPEPVQPKVLVNVAVGVAVGLMLAFGLAALAETLDSRLLSGARVARYTGLPVLGVVGVRRKKALAIPMAAATATPVSSGDYAAHASDPFRLISSNVEVASARRALRSVLVTSASPREGKTVTAANLAIVLAQAGKRVVLLDADLRAPRLHELFGGSNAKGLSSLLLDEQAVARDALVQTNVERLVLLPSGPLPPDPSKLLASAGMRLRLTQLCELADTVIVDSSPVLAVSDSALLASVVDGVLLVADAQRTRGQDAADTVAILRQAGAWVIGVVVNRAPGRPAPYYREQARSYDAQLQPTAG